MDYRSTNQRIRDLQEQREAVTAMERAIKETDAQLTNARKDLADIEAERDRRARPLRQAAGNPRHIYDLSANTTNYLISPARILVVPPEMMAPLEELQEPHQRALGEVNGLERRLQRLRTTLAVTRVRLAEAEATMTPGELVQSGKPAPEAIAHRERIAAGRARFGIEV